MKTNEPTNTELRNLELETMNDIYELQNTVFDIYKRIAKRHGSIPAETKEYFDKELEYMEERIEEFHTIVYNYLTLHIQCMYCRTDDLNEFALETRNYDHTIPRYVCDNCANAIVC